MTTPSITSGYISGTSKIGRYFSLVSAIPAFLLVVFTYVLVASGAWTAAPQPSLLVESLGDIGIGEVLVVIGASLAIAVTMHPLQFALVQLLEGYWGTSPLGVGLAERSVRRHQHRLDSLLSAGVPDKVEGAPGDPVELNLAQLIARREGERLSEIYPPDESDVMPTRFGNVLRTLEFTAGKQYGLEEVIVLPRLQAVMPPDQAAFLDDQREEMDLGVRMTLTWILATAITVLFLWNKGLWLLAALLPYVLALVSYRSAVSAAADYGHEIEVAMDLYRFDFLQAMHVRLPRNTKQEREINGSLMELLDGSDTEVVRYDHPVSTSNKVE